MTEEARRGMVTQAAAQVSLLPDGLVLSDTARFWAAEAPERRVFAEGAQARTYGEIFAEASALAAWFADLRLTAGDVISVQLPNWIEAAVINIAACLRGLVCNPIVPIYRDAEMLAMLAAARSRCVFIPDVWRGFDYGAMMERLTSRLPELRAVVRVRGTRPGAWDYDAVVRSGSATPIAPVKVDPDSVKLLMFTSGTTGRAKAVLHSHRALPLAVLRAAAPWGIGAGSRILMPSPVTHITGYVCGLEMPFFMGTDTVLMEHWDAAQAVRLIDEEGVHATVGATPFLKELVDAAARARSRLPSLRVFACGGAAVPSDLVLRANDGLAARVFRVYGATEVPLVTFGTRPGDPAEIAAHTDGRVNGYDIKIADPAGCALARNQEGEVLVRGPGMFLGYNDSADNADAFDEEGYFRTGDLGILNEADALVITGRKKDLIIRGGENISAREIEDVLLRDERIREAAAVAMPHERLGETVCLFVVLSPGASLDLADVTRLLEAEGLAKQKFPERLERVEALPKTPSGKVQKNILRERARHFRQTRNERTA